MMLYAPHAAPSLHRPRILVLLFIAVAIGLPDTDPTPAPDAPCATASSTAAGIDGVLAITLISGKDTP